MIQDIQINWMPACAMLDCPFPMSVWDIYCDVHIHCTKIQRQVF